MAIIPTSWTDLNWDNPDATDVRYYQSLIFALHERMWQQPLTPPLDTNIYPWYIPQGESQNGRRTSTTEDDYRYGRITIPVWDLGGIPRAKIFAGIYGLFDEVAFGQYTYGGGANAIYNYIKAPADNFNVKDNGCYDGYVRVTIDDIWDEDTCGMIYAPQVGAMLDIDNAAKFLLSMKTAIQKLRYIPVVSGNYFASDFAGYDTATDDVRFDNLGDAIDYLLANMSSDGGKTHAPHDAKNYWRLSRLYGYRSTRIWHREARWVNTFNHPVDLFAKIYGGEYVTHVFDAFGTGYADGQIISYGKKDIGDGIDNIFGAVYPMPDGFVPPGDYYAGYPVSQNWDMYAGLIADAGPYFNFNCSD